MDTTENNEQAVVYVIDDDSALRDALKKLFELVSLRAETFSTANEFLSRKLPDAPACIVLDIRLPSTSGLELQTELARAGIKLPIVFMSGYSDVPMTVQAMKAGALDFLPKPFRDQDMVDAVHHALQRDRARRQAEKDSEELRAHFEILSHRERQVMVAIARGLMNKQIAAELGVAEITVKLHRSSLMRKMNARSIAELARMAQILGVAS
jgi:FixJ family two-component response regulator